MKNHQHDKTESKHNDKKDHDNHDNHDNHNDHSDHDDHDDHAGHSIEDFKKRFFVSLILMVPILMLSPMIQGFIGIDLRFTGDSYLLFGLATVVYLYGGKPFLLGVVHELKDKTPGMMTLIALAISVAYFYSSAVVVFNVPGHEMFWELATLIVIMLLGHWIEMRSIEGASKSISALIDMMPQKANLVTSDGKTKEVSVEELQVGDHVLVRAGDKIPVDGIILKGDTQIDESMVTGESVPVHRSESEKVVGGSVNGDGTITVEIEKTGSDTFMAKVIDMVRDAQGSKTKTQNLANKAAKWLFYVAVTAGILTFGVWSFLGFGTNFAIERMVTVMVITCPHALGLAIPLVIAVSAGITAQKGLLIRNRNNFESARNIDAVVFDKTGTLTEGTFGVTDLVLLSEEYDENESLRLSAAVESSSSHPIAKGITNEAKNRDIDFPEADDVKTMSGKGVSGKLENKEVSVVSPGYMKEHKLNYSEDEYQKLAADGKTVVFLIVDQKPQAMIALADKIRESSIEAVKALKEMGIRSIMITGDNRKVAESVGKTIGIDEVMAEVLPEEKAAKIKELQGKGYKVAMTGDGINDAPALATADLGIAVGAGTDVAIETADLILVKSDPLDVSYIISFSKKIYRKMIQNLVWATGYNVIALPLAAGVLYNQGIVLNPAAGAVLMSLSTVIVAINARMLKG